MNKTLLLAAITMSLSAVSHADQLDDVLKSGTLRVGTTGDYKPFSYYDGNQYSGYDIDVAKHVAKQLGVELKFVQTTWKGLLADLNDDKYDIAMGGITRKMQRQLNAEQTQGYMAFGKCFLVAKGTKDKFNTLEKVNKPSVRVGVNIGGTNESFADTHLTEARFTRFENNLDVPKAVATGKVDVMVTETPEGLFYQVTDQRLEAARCDKPFTNGQFGYLVPKGEQRLLNTINFIMDDMKLKNIDEQFMINNSLK
ncbi:cyclohexadienyl dehydratase [Vibrio sp. 10N.286.49.C2]|uniref:transporter substrate-binding domain-containing protein n=1 Tax=unclassified Vibrio TaxID=2614977 RepID=UPI000C848712|nr:MULTISPECIES: transporter substrate-binding domain-containing protein [unclassified Vibrio]PMH40629.1 cyclohexadienyl dehydratase [Vibrio sp. 10N.286.49.C2]PMH45160.1 cyclohexadienyl dehydratase [Vibrio sp. 10N.286.49.B1]PMH83481.1 cyclohexadienyl dehydratase [Vibrio sp. 10N.286.48.B7]